MTVIKTHRALLFRRANGKYAGVPAALVNLFEKLAWLEEEIKHDEVECLVLVDSFEELKELNALGELCTSRLYVINNELWRWDGTHAVFDDETTWGDGLIQLGGGDIELPPTVTFEEAVSGSEPELRMWSPERVRQAAEAAIEDAEIAVAGDAVLAEGEYDTETGKWSTVARKYNENGVPQAGDTIDVNAVVFSGNGLQLGVECNVPPMNEDTAGQYLTNDGENAFWASVQSGSLWFRMEIKDDDLWIIFQDSTIANPFHIDSAGDLILTI